MPRLYLPLAAVCLAACGGATPPPAEIDTAQPEPDEGDGALVTLEMRDATVEEVLRAVTLASGTTAVVAPQAQPFTECTRLSVSTPAPAPAEALLRLLTEALAGTGLALTTTDDGVVLRREEETPLHAGCRLRARATTAERAAAPRIETILEGIIEDSPTERRVTRPALEAMLESSSALMRSARILPYERDGRVQGFKLYGVRRRGLLGALGFRNGDVVQKIGEHRLNRPESALVAYSELRGADSVVIEVLRRGRVVLLRYRVVDAP